MSSDNFEPNGSGLTVLVYAGPRLPVPCSSGALVEPGIRDVEAYLSTRSRPGRDQDGEA